MQGSTDRGNLKFRAWEGKPRSLTLVLSGACFLLLGKLCVRFSNRRKGDDHLLELIRLFKLSCFQHTKVLQHALLVLTLPVLDEVCSLLAPAPQL